MAFTAYGYQKMREALANTVMTHIELQDATGVGLIRLTKGAAQVVLVNSPSDADTILGYKITVDGSMFTPGQTVSKLALFDVASGGTALDVQAVDYPVTFEHEGVTGEFTYNINTPL